MDNKHTHTNPYTHTNLHEYPYALSRTLVTRDLYYKTYIGTTYMIYRCYRTYVGITLLPKIYEYLANFYSLFLFGKMLSLLWQSCDIIRLIFNVANGQILKKNLVTLPRTYFESNECKQASKQQLGRRSLPLNAQMEKLIIDEKVTWANRKRFTTRPSRTSGRPSMVIKADSKLDTVV